MSLQISDILNVKDKIVVITGGGSGLGKALAEGFSSDGAKVHITGRRTEVLEKAAAELNAKDLSGGQVIAIPGDVASKDGCSQLVKNVSEESHIDVLINNAGLPAPISYPPWDPNDGTECHSGLCNLPTDIASSLQRTLLKRGYGEASQSDSFTSTNNDKSHRPI
ncbi:hypothetical protein BDW69DRAFT_189746 [Aspergillus filifer]